jgi:hypothetical protein
LSFLRNGSPINDRDYGGISYGDESQTDRKKFWNTWRKSDKGNHHQKEVVNDVLWDFELGFHN